MKPQPRKGLDWDDEDLTTRVFDRPDELSPPLSDSVQHSFDADHTSRLTLEELDSLRAQLTSEDEQGREHRTSMAPSRPVSWAVSGREENTDAATSRTSSYLARLEQSFRAHARGQQLGGLTLVSALGALGCVALFALAGGSEPGVPDSKPSRSVPAAGASSPLLGEARGLETDALHATKASRRAKAQAETPRGPGPEGTGSSLPTRFAHDSELMGSRDQQSSLTGVLRVQARPWAKVYVDGSPLGISALTRLELVAGPHEIKLENEALGLRRTLRVHIAPGATETHLVEL